MLPNCIILWQIRVDVDCIIAWDLCLFDKLLWRWETTTENIRTAENNIISTKLLLIIKFVLLQHCQNSWRVTRNSLPTHSRFSKEFEKVAKRLSGFATIDDGRRCTCSVLAIIGDRGRCGGNSIATIGRHHVASTFSAQFRLVWMGLYPKLGGYFCDT